MKCDFIVNLEGFFEMKYGLNDPRAMAVKYVNYSLSYKAPDNYDCTFSGIASTGNPEMDREVQGAARASRDQMIEIIKLWLHSGNGHDYKKYNYKIEKISSYYHVTENNREGDAAYEVFNDQLLLIEEGTTLKAGESYITKDYFEYLNTPYGYLMKRLISDFGDIESKWEFKYNLIQKFPTLSTVTIENNNKAAKKIQLLIAAFGGFVFNN